MTLNIGKWKKYHYYATPDGTDLFPKLCYTSAMGATFGVCLAVHKVVPVKHAFVPGTIEILRIATPFTLCGAIYAVTAYASTKFRQKDDTVNAVIGGATSGAFLGTWYRNPGIAVLAGVVLAAACGVKKYAVLMNLKLPGKFEGPEYEPPLVQRMLDFTLLKETKGNWTNIRPQPVQHTPPQSPSPPTTPKGICSDD